MNYFTRTVSLVKISFHSSRIRQYRQRGQSLMRSTGELVSPQLMRLNHKIDRHGFLLHQLERELMKK